MLKNNIMVTSIKLTITTVLLRITITIHNVGVYVFTQYIYSLSFHCSKYSADSFNLFTSAIYFVFIEYIKFLFRI